MRTILPVRNLEEEGKFIFFATRKGTVKKTPLKDFCNVMARGIIAIGIDDDDELIGACSYRWQPDHLPRDAFGYGDSLRRERRPLHGPSCVWRARHRSGRKVTTLVGLAITPSDPAWRERPSPRMAAGGPTSPSLILSITEQGYGKRTDVDEYRLQTRGGRGVINVKTTARNGKVERHPAGR